MVIEIKKRMLPFSVTPGASFLLPGSSLKVTTFPAKLEIEDIVTEGSQELLFSLTGPITGYFFAQDLERGALFLRGESLEGFYEIKIESKETVTLSLERWKGESPFSGTLNGNPFTLRQKETIQIQENSVPSKKIKAPSFFLGVNKKQEIEKIYQRNDLKELLPLLYTLSCFYPFSESGSFPLLEKVEELKGKKGHKQMGLALLNTIQAHFPQFLVPTLKDEGRGFQAIKGEVSPLSLFKEIKALIFSLFFEERSESLFILPHLLPEFFSGRWTKVSALEGKIEISLEWTKKTLRRMEITAKKEGNITLEIPSSLKGARLCSWGKKKSKATQKGKKTFQKVLFPYQIELEEGRKYFFDCFEA